MTGRTAGISANLAAVLLLTVCAVPPVEIVTEEVCPRSWEKIEIDGENRCQFGRLITDPYMKEVRR